MTDILKEMLKLLPEDKISASLFEGANIVFYTKDKDFFFENGNIVRSVVDKFKKRVELRPDPSITMAKDKAEKKIKSLIPKEAGLGEILFDPHRSIVIIHAEKPGIAIGKQGSILVDIRKNTLWVPLVKRTPPVRSKLIEDIRSTLYEHSDERRKFLDRIGHRVYDGWIRERRQEWIRVSYLGGGREVGRSCILLQTPESRVLLDCGLNLASDDNGYPLLEAPEFDINELDAVIVTDSHLDHSGVVPLLFKYGYNGPVYCTAPTRDVMALLHLDMIKIQRNEGKEPIFSTEEIKKMVMHTICLDYEEVTDITPDVRITLYNAGHILGSSMVHLHIGNGFHNMLYTGDMKFSRTRLLDGAALKFPRLETLLLEATYGGRDNIQMSARESDEMLSNTIKETINQGGKLLMPVLGSGRAQEMMLLIESLVRTKIIPEVPVFVDGMVWDITAIHTAYPEYLNLNVRKQIFHKDNNPFLSEMFKQVTNNDERKKVIDSNDPCIVIATPGMLTGGPSAFYFKHFSPDEKNAIIFSCYQGDGSLGRMIQRGNKEIGFAEGQKQEVVQMKMNALNRLEVSGHSDRRELMAFVSKVTPRPRKVIVAHGESSRCLDLSTSIHKLNRVETIAPRNLDAIRIK